MADAGDYRSELQGGGIESSPHSFKEALRSARSRSSRMLAEGDSLWFAS